MDLIPQEAIADKILVVRDKKVLLDRDLAELYEGINQGFESDRKKEHKAISR